MSRAANKLVALIVLAIAAVFTVAVFAIIATIPTYLLWNWLMPIVFKLPLVTFWQAFGLNWLAAILFKSSSRV